MSLHATRKRKLDIAIDSSAQPYRNTKNNLLLSLGGKSYTTLQGSSGGLTTAGKYYYAKSGQAQPDEFDGGTLQQRGATEYLVRAGKSRVLRRFRGGGYDYTPLGKRYFRDSNNTTSYLVNVPGLIKKNNSKSKGGQRTVPHTAFMTQQPLTIIATMTRQQQEKFLKARVLEHIQTNLDYDGQGIILYQDSSPVYYDEEGQWTLDIQTVVQNEDGRVQTTTVLDRELGATPLLPADMFMPHCLCEEALQDQRGDCVAVQLAALLKMPLKQVHDEIEQLWQATPAREESWRTAGVDSRIIGTFVTNQGMNCFVLWKGRKIREYRARTNRRKGTIAFTVDGTHAWFYGNTEARRAASHLRVRDSTSIPQSKVAVDSFETKHPQYSEWCTWAPHSKEEGYFE